VIILAWRKWSLREQAEMSVAEWHGLLLVRMLALARVSALCLAAWSLAARWDATRAPWIVVTLLCLVAADNIFIFRICFRLSRADFTARRLATLDVCLGMAALLAMMALLKPTANPVSDDVLYPYTVASVSVIGAVYRRLRASLVAAALCFSAYVAATAWRFGVSGGVFANAATYWAWAAAGWFVGSRVMELSRGLDEARAMTARQQAELAREREQARHAGELHALRMAAATRELEQERARAQLSRALHDRVLQTLEFLGGDGLIADPRMRDQVAAEATWLRDLVRGELSACSGTLSGALDLVVERQTRSGMRIQLNTSGLGQQAVSGDIAEAISGAVTELLTNVHKHSGVRQAVVRAVAKEDVVTITVLDRGRGFAPAKFSDRVGLRESVIARIGQVGGSVVVTSWPGAGTHVEIKVPLPAPQEAMPQNAGVPKKRDVPEG
jgi:signal transduction histidine kinase